MSDTPHHRHRRIPRRWCNDAAAVVLRWDAGARHNRARFGSAAAWLPAAIVHALAAT